VTRFNERSIWVRKFLRHGTKIASITPSSRWLCSAMCRDIDPTRPQNLVELGTGTGPLTEMVLEKMHPESTFLSIEVDPDLHALATARCPDADIALTSVEHLPDLLTERNMDTIDVCMSCLPVPSLPQYVNRIILDTWSRLNTSGFYTQITQVPWWYLPLYRRIFRTVQFELVLRNPPPGGVYHCSDLYEDFEANHRLPGKVANTSVA
jgi:phospholipid N-methyltransferase